jgi:hypothetical protein
MEVNRLIAPIFTIYLNTIPKPVQGVRGFLPVLLPFYHKDERYGYNLTMVRQEKLGTSSEVKVQGGKGLTSHPYRVLRV